LSRTLSFSGLPPTRPIAAIDQQKEFPHAVLDPQMRRKSKVLVEQFSLNLEAMKIIEP
jgi:hypothetical protein